jgi:hypothetical protein
MLHQILMAGSSYFLICGLIWSGFSKIDDTLKETVRLSIADYLRKRLRDISATECAKTFLSFADRALQMRGPGVYIRWPSLKRTITVSFIAIMATYIFFSIMDYQPQGPTYDHQIYARQMERRAWGEAIAFAITLGTTPIFDYFSVVKARAVFQRLTEAKSKVATVMWLLLDLLITILIACIALVGGFFVTSSVLGIINWVNYGLLHRPLQPDFLYDELGVPVQLPFFAVCISTLASGLIFSVWLWLYGMASTLVQLARAVGILTVTLEQWCDLDKKPLRVLACVSILLFTAMFWTAAGSWLILRQ